MVKSIDFGPISPQFESIIFVLSLKSAIECGVFLKRVLVFSFPIIPRVPDIVVCVDGSTTSTVSNMDAPLDIDLFPHRRPDSCGLIMSISL